MAMKIIEQKTNSLGVIIIKVHYNNGDQERKISKWCNEHQCGKRVAIQRFAFTQEELTMFRLRWENT
jgi:hypothetical protein